MDQPSALEVMQGVEAPPSFNPHGWRRPSRPFVDVPRLFEELQAGSRKALGQAITLVESAKPSDRVLADRLLEMCLAVAGNSIRIGVTGTPGVGKSTLLEALGRHLLGDEGRKIAVLAMDPTSARTHGSILGDKSRMPILSQHDRAFVRPSPACGALGGVAYQTREVIAVVEAAGYDTVFVETVGVGQSETLVHQMVDCFLLLLLPNSGDELQGIKRGVMELADVIAITKADGSHEIPAKVARQQVMNALMYVKGHEPIPDVQLVSSVGATSGMKALWGSISAFLVAQSDSGASDARRSDQAVEWMNELFRQRVQISLFGSAYDQRVALANQVREGHLMPRPAADRLFQIWQESLLTEGNH